MLESGETDTEVIQETLDEAVCGINDLQEEFDENDSESKRWPVIASAYRGLHSGVVQYPH